jgi:hypothetical protein
MDRYSNSHYWACVFFYHKKKRSKKAMNTIRQISFTLLILLSLPITAFAHGSEEEHQREVFLSSLLEYGFYTLLALFLFSIVLLWLTNKKISGIDVKKQAGRKEKEAKEKLRKLLQISMGVLLLATAVTGVFALSSNNQNEDQANTGEIDFMHIHGLGFTGTGNGIYVPAHDGLRVFKDGKWEVPEVDKHDYMGFSMVDDGFYSSGHPSPTSNMKNPFGVVKSEDMGQSLETLDLYGEVDFHGMAVGYKSHAIYVLNQVANSRMEDAGLYYTTDETETWNKSAMDGLSGQPSAVAVHPSDEGTIVITTNEGVFISTNFGDTFEKMLPTLSTAATFTIDGKLVIGSIEGDKVIIEVDPNSGEQKEISIPNLDEDDAISYIAVNPQNPEEIVYTTYKKDIFITKDSGVSWTELANEGVALKVEQTSESN